MVQNDCLLQEDCPSPTYLYIDANRLATRSNRSALSALTCNAGLRHACIHACGKKVGRSVPEGDRVSTAQRITTVSGGEGVSGCGQLSCRCRHGIGSSSNVFWRHRSPPEEGSAQPLPPAPLMGPWVPAPVPLCLQTGDLDGRSPWSLHRRRTGRRQTQENPHPRRTVSCEVS